MFSTVKTGCPAQQIGREYSLPDEKIITGPSGIADMIGITKLAVFGWGNLSY
jgi:hypothetical protein